MVHLPPKVFEAPSLKEKRSGVTTKKELPLPPVLMAVLNQRIYERDKPTDTHYTLEVSAYWKDDFLDCVRAGLRRRIVIGGLQRAGQNNLAVELAPPLQPYTAAIIHGPRALIVFPESAVVALYRAHGGAHGVMDSQPSTLPWLKAPFAARVLELQLNDRCAFAVETLTFLFRFVHRDGRPRHRFDWIPAAIFTGYMGCC